MGWNTGAPINIQKGVRGNRRFLSTSSNGGKVDLWRSVGIRQKWNLVKAGKGYYHIMLSFGVEGRGLRLDNAYLSVTPNGQKVDVYDKDDASGRQRWQKKKIRILQHHDKWRCEWKTKIL